MYADRFGDSNKNGLHNDEQTCDQPNKNQIITSTGSATRRINGAKNSIMYPSPSQFHHSFEFKPFTRESLAKIRKRRCSKLEDQSKARQTELEPEPYLASGQQLPPVLLRQLPGEFVGTPLEDIDPYYADKETFVIISRGKELIRFSATKSLCVLGPFHPIRRIVLCILVNPIFNLLVMLTIITNCILMTLKGSDTEEKTELLFTIVYTTEMGLKVLARGFIMHEFTYLRDPWNWLDFAVIIMAYLTIVIKDLGNLSVMRTFRVLRALKTVAIIPGMKTIVGAVIDSVKNLKDVVVLTLFSLSVFSLLGLQIYMGQLTQKCILNGPDNMNDTEWFNWCNDTNHWVPDPDAEIYGAWRLCGNATGAQSCPRNHTCLQGFGPNPDYGYTNFDTFGWALICSFRLMTQDFWEGLYMQVLKTAGSWHIIFFIISIFLGSIYLMNLILAIVAMSYNELQRRAEEEEEAAAEEEAAFLESCRQMEMQDRNSLESESPREQPSYRPSIEIGLMGQSFLAGLGTDWSQRFKPTFSEDSSKYRLARESTEMSEADQANWLTQRSRSLCNNDTSNPEIGAKTGGSVTHRSSKIFRSGLIKSSMAASLNRLRFRRQSRDSGHDSITISHGRDPQNNSKNASDNQYPVTRRVSQLRNVNDDGTNTSPTLSADDSLDRDTRINELRQRATLIRIVSDDCSNDQASPQAAQYTLDALDEPIDRSHGQTKGSVEGTSSFLERGDSHHLKVNQQSMLRAKSQDLGQASQESNRQPHHEYHLHLSPKGNRYRSESVICGQPVSLHQYSAELPADRLRGSFQEANLNTAAVDVPSNRSIETIRTTPDHVSIASEPQSPVARVSSVEKNSKLAVDRIQHLASSSLSPLNVDSHRMRSYNNVYQLTIDSGSQQNIPGSSMHYLSVENFEMFKNRKPPTVRSSFSHRSAGADQNPKNASPTGTFNSIDQNPSSHSQELELPSQSSRKDSRAFIHPATMARSSFARPRASLMPIKPGYCGPPNRRMSQQDYLRRASNWSRSSYGGNSDMRRLLRLWAHTNPYQWNNGARSTGGSIVSSCNNVNAMFASPVRSTANSPRPSSVGSARQAYELISALSRRRSNFGFDQRYAIPQDLSDEISVNLRDKCVGFCLSCMDSICIWECCGVWLEIQKIISIVVFDPFTELFIILCILINTLFMALDSDDIEPQVKVILERGNYFFTATFAVEASLKILALSPKFYFREGWNVFDAVIVALSLLELCLEGVYGLSVLRSFRLLRVFKLAKSWPTLNLLISIMGKAMGDLGNLTFVLAIIVFIFAVMGMQLFGNKYVAANFPNEQLPRWNFTDFMHSFMIVFRILCAEWIEPMWDCLLVGSWPCIPFFLIAVTVGNLVVLNLFLALLLASFGASNLSSPQSDNVDTKKLDEAVARFSRFGRWIRRKLLNCLGRIFRSMQRMVGIKPQKRSTKSHEGSTIVGSHDTGMSHIVDMSKREQIRNIEMRTELLREKIKSCSQESSRRKELHNLSNLAKTQAKKCARRRNPNSYNFHLTDQASGHRCVGASGPNHLSNLSSSLTPELVHQTKTPIPIIVNGVGELEGSEHGHSINRRTESASSSVSTNSASISSDSWRSGNADIQLYQTRNLSRSNGMEPIREDSRDADTSDDSLNNTKQTHGSPPTTSAQVTRRPESNSAAGSQLSVVGSQHSSCNSIDGGLKKPKQLKNTTLESSSILIIPNQLQDMEEDDERALQHVEKYIDRCICIGIICLRWFLFRRFVRKIVTHQYFDRCILVLIVISSGTLALEDKHLKERPTLKLTLDALDTLFTIIFSLEMILKWVTFGIRRYFSNIWSWLDFFIVMVSFVNLMASIFGSGKIQALKTMRTLRAMRGLRPLRALQRFQGMRVVVNALIQAVPSIFNVLLVCLIFWLIFSIMGVQMFGGKFWRCTNSNGDLVSVGEAKNKMECIQKNLTWSNPQINFDNVPNAYLALFQVATFKGWIDIMASATDSRMKDEQPVREANILMYFYFVFFVIFGSFFTLNLFIGVIIDNFNEQKKKTGGSLEIFMTEDQKKYYHAMKKMKSKRPVKAMTRPKLRLQALVFDMTTSKKFDMTIMIIIGFNMFVMALEHYGQSQEFSLILENLNLIFIAIFTLECLCKIFAMRHFYFREPWNVFDFIVVNLSILGVVMKEYVAKYFVSPTLLRVVRVVKVGRVLRLVKGAKGIRTLLFALAMSLPALFNICLLLFLVMFIYAIFGMSFFMNVRKRSGIDETFNFETFSSSIIVLFQMSTSAGWELVLDPLMDEEKDCEKPDPAQGIEGTCGNKAIAIFYLISYVIVTFLIIINMYIAVILENYSQATEDVQEGLTDDDYEMYYEIWQKFDPDGTQYLPYDKLSDFLDNLEDPLRIPKPNELAIVMLDINIYEGNRCYCVDILDALTKYFFTRKGLVIQVDEQLEKVQSSIFHCTSFEKITTTYMLKRQHYCAKLIQNCWRKWREAKRPRLEEHETEIILEKSPDIGAD